MSLQEYLAEFMPNIQAVAMEVSSHALDQSRCSAIAFDTAIFTNLSHDHLDYHNTFAEYRDVKKSFFDMLPKSAFALTNKDDKNGIILKVIDEGKGFKETNTKKIFDRFYSNRPDNFGEHSGLGLNIVKNLVELHGASISAANNTAQKGANIEIMFPKA